MSSPSFCSVVLNWKGKEHLQYLLPTLVEAHRRSGGTLRILHNGPSEESLEWVNKRFPEVVVHLAPSNEYLYSYNWLIPLLDEEVVVLLNNDLKVKEDFFEPLLKHFSDSLVFSVCAHSLEWDGSANSSGPVQIRLHRGWVYNHVDFKNQNRVCTAFASGGFMAVDRKKFIEIGGFDRLYYPAYGEDMDLGFRAWLRGWKSIYEPSSVVFHRESASWDSINNRSRKLSYRAHYLFRWRYFGFFTASEALYLIVSCVRELSSGNVERVQGLILALQQWRTFEGKEKRKLIPRKTFKSLTSLWGEQTVTEILDGASLNIEKTQMR